MKRGFTAGNFDILHPGYIALFKECKSKCDEFTILLHEDPSLERPEKLKPIFSLEERITQLNAIRYIDAIMTYRYESDLLKLIEDQNFDVRFLGDDYRGKSFTGDQFNIPIHFVSRSHGWSTTKMKKLIVESISS